MTKNKLNTNKQFMFVNGVLAFGVIAVVVIFLYMSFSFSRNAKDETIFSEIYNITITKQLANDSIAIYVNDSLLFNKKIPNTQTTLSFKRFAEDNVLMVVDKITDETTPFNLSTTKKNITISKSENRINISDTK